VPRLALAAWAVLAGCFVVGWLGGVLNIPAAVANLSPYTHVPGAPADPIAAGPLVALTAAGLGMIAAGVLGFRRRDVG
jgi:ABC-2 type transport system permease protein